MLALSLAFAAGLVSFLSPCVLPLVPAYAAYLAGEVNQSAGEGRGSGSSALLPRRTRVVASGAAFVAGVSLVFIPTFYLLRAALTPVRGVVLPVAGVLVILLALQTAGILRLPFLYREFRFLDRMPERGGALGAFLLGLGFAAGWTPCIGATLGAVISSAINEGASAFGLLQMVVYSLGLGLPFLLLAVGIERAASLVRALGRHRRLIDLTSAAVLVIMGLFLLTDNLLLITSALTNLLPYDPFGL
ncbi:MAG: cytochrome c biogenesis protein CcdA [Candidatus Dormibacteraeota bacterium]|uniref:Cytochrome c biogenesis protein CcdA n=1 Tax=Candidatus Dormiibacter inghamiae TaxID=3127013 RepID=A0A934KD98_9BACT|nr:cytochrome c biogenesis protein CcdA [Candidatus Dormibacteraeota bacterium]MBJ7606830.1 cytochrome c biogenesis protein CcdA [Candidatus Dormibacteraeota bacterium]